MQQFTQKKLVFFDGDGTLWYPRLTKRTEKPHWVYHDLRTKDDVLSHLELTPGAAETLRTLYASGVRLVVISANPADEAAARADLKERLVHFGLLDFLYSYRVSRGDDPNGKAAIMLEILRELSLEKIDALMVGDSYFYDYLPAKTNGIDALFIENDAAKRPETLPVDFQTIREVSDVMELLK